MNYSNRKEDEQAEKIVAKFLDENFYPDGRCERVYDKARQFAGTDVVLSAGIDTVVNIDEKCKFQGGYLKKTGVPGFEISRVCRDGIRRDGWFAEENETDLYFFCYPKLRGGYETEDDFLNEENSVSAVEIIAAPKTAVRKYVEKYMSMDAVKTYADSMIRDGEYRDDIAIDGHIYLTRSEKYSEAPVNLIIKMDSLLAIPGVTTRYVVEKDD